MQLLFNMLLTEAGISPSDVRLARHRHVQSDGLTQFKSRDPSDNQVSILEVVGSAANTNDILAVERLRKAKLQSRGMGLNKN